MRVQSLSKEQHFKDQLLEFIEYREEPFDMEFLASSCNNRFVDSDWVRGALWKLEEEGKIVKLNHHYLSMWVLMRRWIRERIPEAELKTSREGLPVPEELMELINELLSERPKLGYLNADEFIRDAIRGRIQQLKKNNGKSKV